MEDANRDRNPQRAMPSAMDMAAEAAAADLLADLEARERIVGPRRRGDGLAPTDPRSARAKSVTDDQRSAGSFESARMITASASRVMPGRTLLGSTGFSVSVCEMNDA